MACLLTPGMYAEVCDNDTVSAEGAWCWFADPRALHYENADGSINATYIGYIDVHGNIRATQMDFLSGKRTEVLVRSFFQPDDHNNPTFLVLPDERVMIFYTRHTDERRIWYRISTHKGDITSLGEEKYIETDHNTTYPSPFILSNDPQHIYLCWRGINWHPTIARLTMPDKNDQVSVDFGPRQIVQSTGARPYAKYYSNGRDKIYMAYTTGHPDNEWPCWLYLNVIDINTMQLQDIKGTMLSQIDGQPFKVNKSEDYRQQYPFTVIDAPEHTRNWVWQLATDSKENPIVALTRISEDKNSHQYLVAKWTGKKWRLTEVGDGGHAFHQSWQQTEKCYSGGMALDPNHSDVIYVSQPTTADGKISPDGTYEIWKMTLKPNGTVKSRTQVTSLSAKNNIRPFVIPGLGDTPLRLCWMSGDYYYWMVNRRFPQGFPTAIRCDYNLPEQEFGEVLYANHDYQGQTVEVGRDTLICVTPDNYLSLRLGRKSYRSQSRFLTSDDWAHFSTGTTGDAWPTRISSADLLLTKLDGRLVLWRDGMIEIIINDK